MCIAMICFLVYDVINFEISLNFLIRPFSYPHDKKMKKIKYLKNEKKF